MYAYLDSARLAPKKANIVAKMVRGMTVSDAMSLLKRTSKKSARIIESLLKSAIANAEHNMKQDAESLVVKTIVVNQGTAYRRGIPMARGRVRPIKKFLCHISIGLGVAEPRGKDAEDSEDARQRKTPDLRKVPRAIRKEAKPSATPKNSSSASS